MLICFLLLLHYTDVSLEPISKLLSKRDTSYSTSAKERLDNQIYHLINRIPGLISTAVDVIEEDIRFTNLKKRSQGYAILLGAAKDIYSDWLINNRTLRDLQAGGDAPGVLYSYGFLATYGVGFGAPLLAGLDDEELICGSYDFSNLIDKYGLNYGVASYYDYGGHDHALSASLESRVSEFDLLVRTKLDCVLGKEDDHLEAAEVVWALDELISAINSRLSLGH